MQKKSLKNAVRAGFSFLELQVAFVLFGIALAGLVPLVVMQSRQLKKLESRCNDQTTYYLVPSSSAWARKLGAAASIRAEDPGPPAPPAVTLIDDGDPGFSEWGNPWEQKDEEYAFGGDHRKNNQGDGTDIGRWEFTGLEVGWYEVLVTWKKGPGEARNAPYTVYDGTVALGTVRVDQEKDPSGEVFEGSPWEGLGTFYIGDGVLRVELSDEADDRVVADAARIVELTNKVEVLSLEKSLINENVTAQVSITVQLP